MVSQSLNRLLLLLVAAAAAGTSNAADPDFIIVGGGTSGLAVANRLSEDSRTSVLVIEAGPLLDGEREFLDLLIPGYAFKNYTKYSWNFRSAPVPALSNRTFNIAAARLVGGSSGNNGMAFARGSRREYDDWARYNGDPGWGWDGLLPFFKRSETSTPPTPQQQQQYDIHPDLSARGRTGPVQNSFPTNLYPHVPILMRAMKALGIPQPRDGQNGNGVGTYWTPLSVDPKTRTRSYSKKAYYDPARGRRNLELWSETLVVKVLFDGKKAVGVKLANGKTVRARKEVVLAAGAVHTPKLLQLSGVGDQRLLKKFGIPVVYDLPGVGNNLQDHAATAMTWNLLINPDPNWLITSQTSEWFREQETIYFHNRTGYLTGIGTSFFSATPIRNASPRFEQLLAAASSATPNLRPDIHPSILRGYLKQRSIILSSVSSQLSAPIMVFEGRNILSRPLSRGYVEITSTDPAVPPAVHWRTYTENFDIKLVTDGIRLNRNIFNSPLVESINGGEVLPGANLKTDEELEGFIRGSGMPTLCHPSGTTHMGKKEDGAVVDTRLRVYGVQGLRVVDAGVMPFLPASGTSCTVYAVAEKAAEIIKRDYI